MDVGPPPAIDEPPISSAAISGGRAVIPLLVRGLANRGIALLGTIALARLLSPAEFGAFAIVTALVTLIAVVGNFGVTAALIQQERPPTDLEQSTAFVAQLVAWSAIAAVVWIGAAWLPAIQPGLPANAPDLARLLAISLLLAGATGIPTAMLTRVLRFGPLAAIEILQQVVYFGVAVILAARGVGALSFGVAAVAQGIVAVIAVNAVWRRWPGLRFDRATARRLLVFGFGYQGSVIVLWAQGSIVPFFGGLAGGLSAVGYLGFAWRNGQLVSAVEEIVTRVAFPSFSRLRADRARMATAAASSLKASLVAVAAIQGWIIATAGVVVPVVFSSAWSPAIVPLQLVCLGSLAGAPTAVLRSHLNAHGRTRLALQLNGAVLIILAVAFPVAAALFGMNGAAAAFVLSSFAGLLLFNRATRGEVAFPWLLAARILLVTAVCAGVAAVLVHSIGGIAGILVSGVAYLAAVIVGVWLVEPGLLRLARDPIRRT